MTLECDGLSELFLMRNVCIFLNHSGRCKRNQIERRHEKPRFQRLDMLFKTTLNWLFNDILFYLVIGSFD